MSPIDAQTVQKAVALLAQGGLIGLPTETVYGLAADATQEEAVRKIFALKGRPAGHPLIVHLSDAQRLPQWAHKIPSVAYDLAEAFWPGPLTMILPRQPSVLDVVTGGHPTVGLRVPAHPVARALLKAYGKQHSGALAAPSANRFGRVSPTQAEHVRAEFGDDVAMVLEGGACPVGIESTILDLSGPKIQLLRPGKIGREALQAVVGPLELPLRSSTPAPGTLSSHYAVAVPTYGHCDPESLPGPSGQRRGWIGMSAPQVSGGDWVVEVLGRDPDSFAQRFYATLRRLEAAGVEEIYIQALPEEDAWGGIRDRVQRACAAHPPRP